MKLSDLSADLNQLIQLLSERYNTEVNGKLSLNPDDVSVILLTVAISTKGKLESEVKTDVVEATATEVTENTTEATSEAQS